MADTINGAQQLADPERLEMVKKVLRTKQKRVCKYSIQDELLVTCAELCDRRRESSSRRLYIFPRKHTASQRSESFGAQTMEHDIQV
jgi:hypothetical protein